MSDISDRLILALDVATIAETEHFVDVLYPAVKMFKIGSQLFTACGTESVKAVGDKGGKVFFDLKFHDIPNTVYEAAKSTTALGAFMMTVHTSGGMDMLKAAVRGASEKAADLKIKKPYIVGVTRLTSDAGTGDIQAQVLQAAHGAQAAGLDGVVCAVSEAASIRRELGNNFVIVTPGIRPKDHPSDDQKRTATARQAIDAGADFIVVGRPILQAKDPLAAVSHLI